MAVRRIGIALPLLGITGGVNVVLNWGVILARAGYRVEVILPPGEMHAEFPFLDERERRLLHRVALPEARGRRYHTVMATWWETIPWLADLDAEHSAWFMQAFEAQFLDRSTDAQSRFDELASGRMNVITIAPWLRRLVERHYDVEPSRTFCVLNAMDRALWRPMPREPLRRGGRPVRFLVEGPWADPRKNIVRTVRLLEQLKLPHSWVGASVDRSVVGPHCLRVEAQVPYRRMPAIYADSDVLVKASNAEGMFGPPLEMFATGGTAACWDVQGAEEYMADRHNCRLVPMNSWSRLADVVRELAEAPDRVRTLQENALATAEAWPTWEDQAGAILATIESLVPTDRSSLVHQVARVEFRSADRRVEEGRLKAAWLESEIASRDARITALWAEAEARGRTIEALRDELAADPVRRLARVVKRTARRLFGLARRLGRASRPAPPAPEPALTISEAPPVVHPAPAGPRRAA